MQSPSQQAQYAALTDVHARGPPQQQVPFIPLHHLSPLPPLSQPYPPPAHFYHPSALLHPASMPPNPEATDTLMHYPAPSPPVATPTTMVMGPRQNKDVKRRTKTGCLTCRKRRIKCDESHPTCRNCDKSGRDCLGYDPIFKPHSAHPAIQPAPPSNTSSLASPTTPTAYNAPPAYPGFGASLDTSSLDPALTATDSPLLFTSAHPLHSTALLPARMVMPIPIDHLISLDHLPPQHQPQPGFPPNPAIPAHEIDDLFRLHFAQGLDKLFETHWYSSHGLANVQQDASLRGLITHCMEQFQSHDPSAVPAIQALEARLVWQLAIMPHQPLSSNVSTTENNARQPAPDLLQRIDTVEALLTGHYLPPNRIPPPPRSDEKDPLKYNEDQFWHHLATLTSLHDDDASDPNIHQSIDDAFVGMRAILGMMENRDVLYSIAVARHFGGRHPDFHPRQQLAVSDSNAEELEKLEVARKFIEAEDQRGTTQVVQRICGLAIRCWALQRRP